MLMLISKIILCILGLIFGASLAAGVVALITSLGIIPRMVGKSATAAHILLYENILMIGAILGNIVNIFPVVLPTMGSLTTIPFGIFSGIFVGCLAAALAEVIQVWPIIFRRSNLKRGLNFIMPCFAFGKLAGGLFFFLLMKK